VNDKQSIIGFTEAELGLFVAILVFIIAGLKYQAVSRNDLSAISSVPLLNQKVQSLAKENLELRARLDSVQNNAKADTKLRSHAAPSCKERGISKGFLFDVIIKGPDTFQVGSNDLDSEALYDSFDSQIQAAEVAGCKHTIRVFYSPGVTTPEYLAARKTLERFFYPKDSGAAP